MGNVGGDRPVPVGGGQHVARVRHPDQGRTKSIALLVATVLLAAGCAEDNHEAKTMGLAQAQAQVTDVVKTALASVGDVSTAKMSDPGLVPCGGIEGSEYTKVKVVLTGGIDQDDLDAEQVFARIRESLPDVEFGTPFPSEAPEQVHFSNKSLGGMARYNVNRSVVVSVESNCVPNPDRER